MRMNHGAVELMRCTVSSCSCVGFKPASVQIRSCDGCGHGWVAHALEKLNSQAQQPSSCGPVEVALPGLVFDLSSLVLYGAQAIPVRMKILLDRLYSILTPEQVGHILHTLGWCLGDYIRGYMLQLPNGNVLDHWLMVTPEEEALILRQFLRFGETRPIVELMTLQCLPAVNHPPSSELSPAPKSCRANISTFIEKNSRTAAMLRSTRGDSHLVSSLCHFKENDGDDPLRHSGNLPGGRSLSLPCYFASSSFHCLVPSAEELGPGRRAAQHVLKPKLVERHEHPGGTREQDHDVIFQPALNIKTDSDKPKLLIRPQDGQFCKNQESELLVDLTKQNETSSVSIPFSSVSPSPSQASQIFQTSSSYPLSPLPPFSSSFLCPLPVPSFSSCHRPLPLSCSLPSLSPAGGRKGRVTCSICGKSFYDKGTLKIHYNAVHLKIKHRCTVVGCTMVFSSLRSRNRHSANPNPRLHTATVRDTHAQRNAHSGVQQTQMHHENTLCKDTRDTRPQMCQLDSKCSLAQTHTLKNRFTGQVKDHDGCSDSTHHQADCPPQLPRSLPQNTNQNVAPRGSAHRLDLLTRVTPPLARSDTLASPELRPGCDCGPTTGKQGGAGSGPLTNRQQIWESGQVASKKKPRKSSMPVKIERERTEEEEEECYIQG